MYIHFRAAKDRYLFRCRSASFFRRMAASEYDLYLHSIIHISCLVFFGRMKYNKNVIGGTNVAGVWLIPKEAAKPADIRYKDLKGTEE